MINDHFRPPQVPRRTKPTTAPIQRRPILFQIESPGQAPKVLLLRPLLARLLTQLAEAGEGGILNTDPNLSGRVCKLRRTGVQIDMVREPRTDGGAGWLARYWLTSSVQRRQEGS